jgi:hypothetical protein
MLTISTLVVRIDFGLVGSVPHAIVANAREIGVTPVGTGVVARSALHTK